MKRSLLYFKPIVILLLVSFGFLTTSCETNKKANAGEKISFSHKTHIEKYNIEDCGTCHKYDTNGTFKGLPSIGECTVCHDRNGVLTSDNHLTPRKKTMFDSYADKDRPWISKARDKELVYYSHKDALTMPGKDGKTKFRCEPCHGDKASSTGKAKLKGEKLMAQCIECHTVSKMNNQCDVCHR